MNLYRSTDVLDSQKSELFSVSDIVSRGSRDVSSYLILSSIETGVFESDACVAERWEETCDFLKGVASLKSRFTIAINELAGSRFKLSPRKEKLAWTLGYSQVMARSEGNGQRRGSSALQLWGLDYSHLLPILRGIN